VNTFHERLKLAVGTSSVREIARRSNLSEATVRAYIKGDSFPGLDKLDALAAALNVRPEWLATGHKPMREGPCVEKPLIPTSEDKELFYVPRFDVEASAGYGMIDQQELIVEYLAFSPVFLRNELGVAPEKLVVIRARGDSMEPTIRDGDLLLIDHSQIVDRTDGIYLVAIKDRLMVKRVQFLLMDELEIISDNKNYRSLVVDLSKDNQVRLVGRVVWTGRRT
jgi:phage repressor protein C with HTH and peptisase S24 domain